MRSCAIAKKKEKKRGDELGSNSGDSLVHGVFFTDCLLSEALEDKGHHDAGNMTIVKKIISRFQCACK